MADNQGHSQENAWGHPYGIGCATHSRWERYAADDWFPHRSMAGRARLRAARCLACRTHRQIRFDGKILVMTVAHVTHRLRHVIKQLVGYTPDEVRNSEAIRELAGYCCLTRMH